MLQRIYGTAWFKKEELDAYLHPARGGAQARPPGGWAGSWTCSCSTVGTGRGVLDERGTTL